jgi:hypothetical protein
VLGLPLADLLPFSSVFYGALIGIGFLIGIYGHAAKMPKLTLFGILLVFVSTLLTMLAASNYDGGLPPDVKGPR